MVQAPVEKLTLDAFLSMPETKPASEFIDGKIIQKPMPQTRHGRIQLKLAVAINEALEDKKIASAFPELRCTFGGRSIVPDIGVLTWERLPLDEDHKLDDTFKGHPDWAIEILSPQQNATKVVKKLFHSLEYGTQMGWLIIPEDSSIMVCPKGKQPQIFEEEKQVLPVPAFAEAVRLTHGDVFGWLQY
ncbi:MAG: Uma2 family endonuclease [Cyanobacteria bacterium P01_A01_bin.116]